MKHTLHLPRRAAAALLLALCVLTALPALPARAATVYGGGQILPDGEYALLCHDNTNRCLNIGFASRTEDRRGAAIIDGWSGEANEVFLLRNRGGGYVTLSPRHAPDLCLNALLGNKTPGDGLALHRYTAGDACSLWLPVLNDDGSVTFRNKHTGLCMDVSNGAYHDGNPVISWTPNGYLAAQAFYLKPASPPAGDPVVADGVYALQLHDDRGLCVNVGFASTRQDRAGAVIVDHWSGEPNESFRITNRGGGRVTIQPMHAPDLCLNALLASPVPGQGLALHGYTEGDMASLWLPLKNSDGSVSFRNCATGYLMDVRRGDYSLGSQIISWHSNAYQRSQSYWLARTSDPAPAPAPSGGTLTCALYGVSTDRSYITCGFDGYVNTRGRHEGIDFKRGLNCPVYALTDGVVTRVTFGSTGSGGLSTIAVYNSAQDKTVIYLHTRPLAGLSVGQTVRRGDQIAAESWRGVSSSSGTHTHVEVRDGRRTSAARSVGDYRLENPDPGPIWSRFGYQVR